jgi:1,4-dihydroxy-2-naphthoyl-CoA hydrolase
MGTFDRYDREIAEAMVDSSRSSAGIVGGGLPEYLRIATTSVAPGRLTCELPVTEELLNPFGAAHGGVVSALIDHALGAVCFPVIERGSWPATQEFKLNFVAPARVGRMVAEAHIVSMSKRTVIVRIDVSNNGRLVCAAQGTVAVMPPKPGIYGAASPSPQFPRE